MSTPPWCTAPTGHSPPSASSSWPTPKGAQIVYEPAPLVRSETLKRHPKIKEALEPIFQSLDLATLQKLNGAISVEGRNAADVARDHLVKGGFLK